MTMAYVLVKISPGKENLVAREIVRIKEVKEAAWTYGFCDVLLKVEVQTIQDLDKIVLRKIRNTPGVVSTETMIISTIPIYASRPPRKAERKRTRTKKASAR